MSHCINLILIKKSELRNCKISTIVSDEKFPIDSPCLHLPQDILAFPELSRNSISTFFGPDITFVEVSTDYFGGCGEQSASILRTMTKSLDNYYLDEKSYYVVESNDSESAIDIILEKYGVIRENGKDEFDTIQLGKYRTNNDVLREINEKKIIKHIIENTKSF